MKYCTYCGKQLVDEAAFCASCGRAIGTTHDTICDQQGTSAKEIQCQNTQLNSTTHDRQETSALKTIAKVFMIIGCIATAGYFLIPLCWTIPMTVHYFNAVKNNKCVGTGFKVCTLIFVSLIAGIIMLCDKD